MPAINQDDWIGKMNICKAMIFFIGIATTSVVFSAPGVESFSNGIPLHIPPSLTSKLSMRSSCQTTMWLKSSPSEELLNSLQRSHGLLRKKKVATWSPTDSVLSSLKRRHAVLRRRRKRLNGNADSRTSYLTTLENGVDEKNNRTPETAGSTNDAKDGPVPLKEDEKFIAAVNEVKVAAQNVTESAGKLTTTIVSKGPGILGRLFMALVSKEMREDIKTRVPHYKSDWTDAFKNKRQTIPAILFLYFSCLAPAVSFGTIASQLTEGSIGVVEFLLGSGSAGMAYSILCGQPMAFIAPTGLTLAFISGLFRFCTLKGIPFFPIYAWVGLWTSFFMITLGVRGSSKLIRFCTRFTDEVFNALLSVNFIYEAFSSLRRNFLLADPMNLSMPFVSLSLALGTFWTTTKVIAFQTSKYFNAKVRSIAKDFGPVAVIIAFSALNNLKWFKKFGVPTLAVPNVFELAGGRKFLVPILSLEPTSRLLCAFPAILLTCLFFMDQNISVRVVNNPDNKLKKGPAYNVDMVALGIITAVLSIFGLPWMCGATVQSMNHVRAMTEMGFNEETKKLEVKNVTETRTTGFIIHALLASTVKLLPMLTFLPIPVVSGVFFFLGRKLMTGNTFLRRVLDSCAEKNRLPDEHPIHILGRKKMNVFTLVQISCLAGLWTFKSNSATAIFFPSVIALLMLIRSFALPRYFTEKELVALGDPTPV